MLISIYEANYTFLSDRSQQKSLNFSLKTSSAEEFANRINETLPSYAQYLNSVCFMVADGLLRGRFKFAYGQRRLGTHANLSTRTIARRQIDLINDEVMTIASGKAQCCTNRYFPHYSLFDIDFLRNLLPRLNPEKRELLGAVLLLIRSLYIYLKNHALPSILGYHQNKNVAQFDHPATQELLHGNGDIPLDVATACDLAPLIKGLIDLAHDSQSFFIEPGSTLSISDLELLRTFSQELQKGERESIVTLATTAGEERSPACGRPISVKKAKTGEDDPRMANTLSVLAMLGIGDCNEDLPTHSSDRLIQEHSS